MDALKCYSRCLEFDLWKITTFRNNYRRRFLLPHPASQLSIPLHVFFINLLHYSFMIWIVMFILYAQSTPIDFFCRDHSYFYTHIHIHSFIHPSITYLLLALPDIHLKQPSPTAYNLLVHNNVSRNTFVPFSLISRNRKDLLSEKYIFSLVAPQF